MRLSTRAADIAVAAAIILLALAISPIGIRFVTGRLDLPLRVNVVSPTFDAFPLILAVTIVARGRARHILFYLLASSLVLAAIAAVEVAAQATALSDRVAPLEDTSTLLHRNRWPPQLMSGGRFVEPDGLRLYRPLRSNEISINDLGLQGSATDAEAAGRMAHCDDRRLIRVGLAHPGRRYDRGPIAAGAASPGTSEHRCLQFPE